MTDTAQAPSGTHSSEHPRAQIGVFGGSGFYRFLDDVVDVTIDTPYGPPSAPIAMGTVGPHRVAFLARHGRHHELPAHQVNFRANLWAMRSLGVGAVIGPCAAGSLQPQVKPGEFVVLDQLVDRTSGRVQTFFDGPETVHVSFADPYDADLAALILDAAREGSVAVHPTGTVVVIQGPRFSTRAESRWFAAQGWEVVNMTQYPEGYLARELGMRYAGIALITDYDAGLAGRDDIEPVTQSEVFAFFEANVHHVRDLLVRVIPRIPADWCVPGPMAGAVPGFD